MGVPIVSYRTGGPPLWPQFSWFVGKPLTLNNNHEFTDGTNFTKILLVLECLLDWTYGQVEKNSFYPCPKPKVPSNHQVEPKETAENEKRGNKPYRSVP